MSQRPLSVAVWVFVFFLEVTHAKESGVTNFGEVPSSLEAKARALHYSISTHSNQTLTLTKHDKTAR